jgi:hypothetical protein
VIVVRRMFVLHVEEITASGSFEAKIVNLHS